MASVFRITVASGLATLALAAAPWPAAAQLPPPRVDYTADWRMETGESTQTGKVFHSAGLERREIDEGGEKMIVIVRPDKKVMWTLMPSEKMVMEVALTQDKKTKDDLSQYDIEQSPVGEESVHGVRTRKSKIIMKEKKPGGAKLGGFWWMTREGIILKMDMLAIEKGSKERFKTELVNLQVGKQDPRLFEIPPGYEKTSGMGGLGKMMMGGGKDDEDKDDDDPKEGATGGKKEGLDVKGVLKIFR